MLTDGSSEWSIVRLPACFFPSLAFSIFGCFFFFNDTATTEIYTLSLHDALPISPLGRGARGALVVQLLRRRGKRPARSEEHTSELQSHLNLVCRLLLEKKKQAIHIVYRLLPHITPRATNLSSRRAPAVYPLLSAP